MYSFDVRKTNFHELDKTEFKVDYDVYNREGKKIANGHVTFPVNTTVQQIRKELFRQCDNLEKQDFGSKLGEEQLIEIHSIIKSL